MDMISIRRKLMAKMQSGGGGLPDEYRRVQYIESTGTQAIDTGFVATYTTGINLVKGATPGASLYNFVFGSGQSNNNQYAVNGVYFNYFSQVNKSTTGQNNACTIEISNGILSIDGVVKWDFSSVSAGATPNSLKLFCRSTNAGVLERFSSMKLYSCKMWDGQTLVRDYVPCYRKADQKPGLYDLVNNQFYTNVGTGEFQLP